MIKVSIIVPVYNAGNTIRRCINSIVHQTLDNIEVIIVDDGSTDDSSEIITHFQGRSTSNCRIRSIHQANCGVGQARNAGLACATGKYVGFVDSDDYIDNTMIEKLYKSAETNNCEIATCGIVYVNGESMRCETYSLYGDSICMHEAFPGLKGIHSSGLLWFNWKSIYSRELISNNKIHFGQTISEDSLFNMEAFLRSSKMSFVHESLYYYDISNDTSITRTKYNVHRLSQLQQLWGGKKEIYNRFGISNFEPELDAYTMYHTIPMLISNEIENPKGFSVSKFQEIRNCEMVRQAFKNCTTNLIHSNLKYIVLLLKFRLYYLIILLLDIRKRLCSE